MRLCGRCHTEYLHRHDELANEDAGRASQWFSAALALVAGFAAAKLWIQLGGHSSPDDFLFMWIPLAVVVGLTYMLLSGLLEDARAARRCERFIVERRERRRRPTVQ